MAAKPNLDNERLQTAAAEFSVSESEHDEPTLYGVTDGKAVGTYVEHKFRLFLSDRFTFTAGNSAKGVDFPALGVDMKATSIRQPQSSCPFKSARQKVYGLGYHLLVMIYDKSDEPTHRTARLDIQSTIFIEKERTADFQMTSGILQILANEGNRDDLIAFMQDKGLPVDDIEANRLADELLEQPPIQGYLTISNALQWRLQYARAIAKAGTVEGVLRLR